MSQKNNAWYNDPLLIAAVQFEQSGDDSYQAPAIFDQAQFNTEQLMHVFDKGIIGLYEKERDYARVKKYLDMCPERNIIMYCDAHIVSRDTYKKHNDWAQRTPGGEPTPGYASEVLICVNSPWRDAFFARIREVVELPIHGIFLDGPLFSGPGCFCPACRKLFNEQFGHSMESGTRTEIREFKTKHIARFIADVRAVIHETRPDVVLYANNNGLSENVTGCDVEAIYDHVDLLGTEGGFIFYCDPNDVSIYRCGNAARYIESKSYGKPYVMFCAANHQPWARYMLSAPENELNIAATVANGANIWYGIHGQISDFETKGCAPGLALIKKLSENKQYYKDTKRRSDVAVVWSKQSIHAFPEEVEETDFTVHEKLRSTEQFGSSQKEFDGICEILSRSHIQFSIIDENNLIRDDLSAFKLIILPNTVCLDSSAAQCVKRYVSGGGNLISTLYSGACDENGVSRPENTLSDVIGAVSAPQRVSYFAGGGYLSVDCGADVSCNPTAGFAGPVVRTRYSEDCQILARMHEPMDGRYSAFKDATYPAIVEHTYGAGKSLYIAGGIGATYKDFGVMDYSELVRTFALRYITPLIKVEGAYESIDILVREQAERTFVHMLNYTGTMRRPIEHTIPCRDISVAVQANNNVTRVHTMLGGKELPFTMSDGMVCVNVDLESAYEVIIFE